MAITQCRLIAIDAGYGIQGEAGVTLRYKVRTDAPLRGVADYNAMLLLSLTASPDPVPNKFAYIGNGAYVTRHHIAPQGDQSLTNFVITVTGGQLPPGTSPEFNTPDQVENPLKRKVIFWIERMSETELVEKDNDGEPIVNSAGQPFDEPYQRERWLPVLVAQKNYATLSAIETLNRTYENAINSTTFRGNAAKTVLFTGIETGPPTFENGITFYVGQSRFIIRKDTWPIKIVNRGYKHFTDELEPDDRVLVNATDENGQHVSEPVLLTEDGRRLPEGEVGNFAGPFEVNPVLDLNPLIADPT
jgi:hypothetical protein